MAEGIRRDWILPVLEDVRDFAREADLAEMADDIDALLARHRDALLRGAAEGPPPEPDRTLPRNAIPFPRNRRS
jgi:hypothetical protein